MSNLHFISSDMDRRQQAVFSSIEHLSLDTAYTEQIKQAFFNILSDLSDERERMQATQSATLNLLEDFDAERRKAESINLELRKSAEQLRAAKEEAESLIRELEAFSYSVSHDLRAPLRHLDGFLSLLSKRTYSSLDPQGKHYIDRTLDASRRMGRLIDDLLQFSRLGRGNIRMTSVNLNKIIDQARAELDPDIAGRTIEWRVDQLPTVDADQGMLLLVIHNLLGNALKFTRNCATTTIEIGCRPGAGTEAVIFVKDNGAGFDMQYYDKLFQVFQRLHSEAQFEGTGIGLANVRRIVERHGGRVWAEGQVGEGATFYFSLPSRTSENGE
jgi:light-regulated signal transduction histidine kinase (bacteriophytochrome)